MSMPIVLIKEKKLKEITLQANSTPIYTIVRQLRAEGLFISQPPLTKLISYYRMYNQTKSKQLKDVLFPKWLIDSKKDMDRQDSTKCYFKGSFPVGEWCYYGKK